jgi:hypothetical protein
MRCLEATDSEGLDVTKAFNHFSIIMNKRKRAARNRKRRNETESLAKMMDKMSLYNTDYRLSIHNRYASQGYGIVVDEVWVREYYERRTILF